MQQLSVIEQDLESYARAGKRLLVSSSFQTHSIPLLHIISTKSPDTPITFLDTGYHFPETLAFRDEVSERLGLELILATGTEQPPASGLWATSEDSCCSANKVQPLHDLLVDYDVWVSGVRADQTSTRGAFRSTMPGPVGTERYHPLLSWTTGDIEAYRDKFDLPAHPLDALGYRSIGCAPCTSRPSTVTEPSLETVQANNDRSGRWSGSDKTECGLHFV